MVHAIKVHTNWSVYPDVFQHFHSLHISVHCVCKKFYQVDTNGTTILNYSKTTKKRTVIDVLASRRKPSSGLTSGAGRQYVKACPIRGSVGSSPRLDRDKLLRTDDWHRKSVLMKASDVKPKRR